jgi:hypothetical protein
VARRDAMENPKIGRLARLLGMDWVTAWGLATALWQWSTKYAPTGLVTTQTVEDFCDRIRFGGDPDDLSAAFAGAGLFDDHAKGWLIHDWPEHCEDSVHMALARKGAYFADGTKPKMNRLSVKEKEEAEALYARQDAQEAHSVQPKGESVRTESAQEAHDVRTSLSHSLSQEINTSCESPGAIAPKRNEPFDGVIIPPEFAAAAEDWRAYRAKRRIGRWVADTWRQNLLDYEGRPEEFAADVAFSIKKGYQGLFPDKSFKAKSSSTAFERTAANLALLEKTG